MDRRKFIAGLGSLTAAGAAGIGTGAFTSVTADRDMYVAVADDANAFLSLDDIDNSPNSEYVDTTSNGIVLNLDSTNAGGSGFNVNSQTRIDDLLQVANQGSQTVNVWVTLDGGSTFDDDAVHFYPGDATETELNNGEGDGNSVLELGTGKSADIGAYIDIGAVSKTDEEVTATFHASVKRGSGGSEQVDGKGEVTGPVLKTDPVDGNSYMTATVSSGATTTITVELDDSVYDWPNNETSHHMEAVINVDNDGIRSYDDDLRVGWAAPDNGNRDGSTDAGGYIKTNFGGSPTVLGENVDGFTATEADDRLSYTLEIDWQAVADDSDVPLSSAPSEFKIEEVYGTDGGGISSSGLTRDETIAGPSKKLPTGL